MEKKEKKENGTAMVPTPKTSLFALTAVFQQLMEVAEEQDGELTEEQLKSLELTREGLEGKALGYANFITFLEGQVALAEIQKKRAEAFLKSKKGLADHLKTNLLRGLMAFGEVDKKGIYRLEIANQDGVLQLSTRRSESVHITDEAALPAEYWRQPEIPAVQPDKKAIKEAIDAGTEVPGAEIQTSYSLSIK